MADKNDLDDEDMLLASAVAVMTAGVACIAAIENELHSTSSGTTDYSSSSSSGSIGRTGRSGKRRRGLVEQIDNLSFRICEAVEAIKSREDFSLTLYSEIMKSEGYDEVSLGKAFDYLLEHENRGRAFLAKNDTLQQAWLSDFFCTSHQKG